MALLDGAPMPEEYPTDPPSFVLNGAIFALWGYDVARCSGTSAPARFERGADALAANIHRWDTGCWSLYDLFPHPVMNVASPVYHALHTSQLEAMQRGGAAARSSSSRRAVRPYAAAPERGARIRAQGAFPARRPPQRADRQTVRRARRAAPAQRR